MKKKLNKVLIFYAIFQIVIFTLHHLAEKPFFNLLSIEHLLVSDISLNDLHYQIKSDNDVPKLSGKIILINTGSLNKDSFRLELSNTMSIVNSFKPKVIGLDHDFKSDTTLIGTKELIQNIINTKNIVIAKKEGKESDFLKIPENVKTGLVTMNNDELTIRKYSSSNLTFAYQISSMLNDNKIEELHGKTFFINYLTNERGFYTKDSNQLYFYLADPNIKQPKFLMLEAKDILNHDSTTISVLKNLSTNRAILFGHFGNTSMFNTAYDIEDKKAVPLNNIVSHEKNMDGLLIHAIAIENIINPDNRFLTLSDSIYFIIFKQLLILLFLYYLLFHNLGKAVNIFSLIILSFPLIYLVLYLMTKNIYLEMGVTLLSFLIIEEFVEIIESIIHLTKKIIKK